MSQLPAFLNTIAGDLLAIALGLAIGSFTGMCAWRLFQRGGALEEWIDGAVDNASPRHGLWSRSRCSSGCNAPIPFFRNIPLVSYVLQGGKSACCKAPVHWRYPVSEAGCALVAWLAWNQFGLSLQFAGAAFFCVVLVFISVVDMEHRIIPDEVSMGLMWCGLLFSLTGTAGFPNAKQAVATAACGYLFLLVLNGVAFYPVKWIRKRRGMDTDNLSRVIGQGDWKMLAAMGAWLGLSRIAGAFAMAMVAGCLFVTFRGTARRLLSTQNELQGEGSGSVPLGPFLAIGGMIVILDPAGIFTEFLMIPLVFRW